MGQTSQQSIQSFAFVLSAGAAICIACGFVLTFGSAASVGQAGEARLDSLINPNEAPVESLIRLPGMGPSRAGAIIAYRESLYRNGITPAFGNIEDLRKVRGIGPKTVQGMSEWITFDSDSNSHDG